MKITSALLLAASLLLGAGTAIAACPNTSAGKDVNKTAGISKDGSHAPLEGAEPSGNKAAKDGGTMPLATEEGGGDKDLATSQQDVEAQQDGEKTAAAKADDDNCK
ncbi:hypothetical protein [Mesorhizobium sp. YM1C-6-2]|uniref:hypothetical protein n=1 Tax=Mesorhizobium sp. YM1C-6-2 TaxID=1827501 RepID=UPI000EF29496|nr:hypothetical protein [Mesorhizobium sp. YM1C-6-2]RLP28368.1 hypothetical protein D8676_04320 [Mesorhizobium sp. YM1C-6-2]